METEVMNTAIETTTEVVPTVAAKIAANPKKAIGYVAAAAVGAAVAIFAPKAVRKAKAKAAAKKAAKENERVKNEQDQKAGLNAE